MDPGGGVDGATDARLPRGGDGVGAGGGLLGDGDCGMRGVSGARGIVGVAAEGRAVRTPVAGPPDVGGVLAGRGDPNAPVAPVDANVAGGLCPDGAAGLADAPAVVVAAGARPGVVAVAPTGALAVPGVVGTVDGAEARGGNGGGTDGERAAPVLIDPVGGRGGGMLAGRGPGGGGGGGAVGLRAGAGTAPSSSSSCVDSRPSLRASGVFTSTFVDSSSRGGVGPAIGCTLFGPGMDLKPPVTGRRTDFDPHPQCAEDSRRCGGHSHCCSLGSPSLRLRTPTGRRGGRAVARASCRASAPARWSR